MPGSSPFGRQVSQQLRAGYGPYSKEAKAYEWSVNGLTLDPDPDLPGGAKAGWAAREFIDAAGGKYSISPFDPDKRVGNYRPPSSTATGRTSMSPPQSPDMGPIEPPPIAVGRLSMSPSQHPEVGLIEASPPTPRTLARAAPLNPGKRVVLNQPPPPTTADRLSISITQPTAVGPIEATPQSPRSLARSICDKAREDDKLTRKQIHNKYNSVLRNERYERLKKAGISPFEAKKAIKSLSKYERLIAEASSPQGFS